MMYVVSQNTLWPISCNCSLWSLLWYRTHYNPCRVTNGFHFLCVTEHAMTPRSCHRTCYGPCRLAMMYIESRNKLWSMLCDNLVWSILCHRTRYGPWRVTTRYSTRCVTEQATADVWQLVMVHVASQNKIWSMSCRYGSCCLTEQAMAHVV